MNSNLRASLIAEFFGTLAFTFVGSLAIYHFGSMPLGILAIAVAHGVILSNIVTASMPTSGGHINPAVTIGFLLTGRIKPVAALAYIVAQLAGATAGSLLIYAILGGTAEAVKAVGSGTFALGAVGPAGTVQLITPIAGLIAEIVATFFLVWVIWGSAADPRARNVGGFAIGLTVAADILCIGPVSGACMNPARMFGPTLVSSLLGKDVWANNWIYWVGPIVGACIAAGIYSVFQWPAKSRAEAARDLVSAR